MFTPARSAIALVVNFACPVEPECRRGFENRLDRGARPVLNRRFSWGCFGRGAVAPRSAMIVKISNCLHYLGGASASAHWKMNAVANRAAGLDRRRRPTGLTLACDLARRGVVVESSTRRLGILVDRVAGPAGAQPGGPRRLGRDRRGPAGGTFPPDLPRLRRPTVLREWDWHEGGADAPCHMPARS